MLACIKLSGYMMILQCFYEKQDLGGMDSLHKDDLFKESIDKLMIGLPSIWVYGAYIEHYIQTTLSITKRRKENLPSIALSFMLLFHAWGILGQYTRCELVGKTGPLQKKVPMV